jgi:hypothetical protein
MHLEGIHIDKSIGGFRVLVRQNGNYGEVLTGAEFEDRTALPFRGGSIKIESGFGDVIYGDIRAAAIRRLGIDISQRSALKDKTDFGTG